jgi:hypothetical protein
MLSGHSRSLDQNYFVQIIYNDRFDHSRLELVQVISLQMKSKSDNDSQIQSLEKTMDLPRFLCLGLHTY